MKRVLLSAMLLGAVTQAVQAQRYFGISNSNWSGTQGMYLNPANIADSRHKLAVEIFSINALGNNTMTPLPFRDIFRDVRNDKDIQLANYIQLKDPEVSAQIPFLELRGPSAFYSINSKHSIGISTRVRFMNQLHDFDSHLFGLVAEGQNIDLTQDRTINDRDGYDYTGNTVSDLGLSWGGVLVDKKQHFLKGGATLRYYRGIKYANMNGNTLVGTYNAAGDTVNITQGDIKFSSNVEGDVIEQINDISSASGFFDYFFGGSAGTAFGADLGLVYEFRPKYASYLYEMDGKTQYDPSRNKYLLKVSASVLDLGFGKMTYKNTQQYTATGSGIIPINNLEGSISNFRDLKDSLAKYGFTLDSTTATNKMMMPTTFLLGVDYNVYKRFYVNASFVGNLVSKGKPGNYSYNQITLTPRYESKVFDFGLPMTYNMTSKDFKMGAGARAGFFMIGTDDVLAFLNNNSKGVNVYVGARFSIANKRKKDSDGDLVSDKRDSCKFEKGVPELKGCPNPDKDGDGILDKDDQCPDVPGVASAKGCPDADGDGVADSIDECPTTPGLPQFNGCPDTDGDGLPDKDDKCPTVAGPISQQGCPDTDGDGVIDAEDKCPNKPGPAENQGCPVIRADVKKRLAFAATAIEFDLGKATIKPTSNKLLDEIVAILNEYSDYNMTIEGHTDNTKFKKLEKGQTSADKNMQLSKERAASVRDYFISKGISADRLSSEGFGETRPVADNKTAAGRAKNRRVDMDLKLR